MLQPPVESGATLIVAPHSITHQWVEEVLRHVAVDALQIFVSNWLSLPRVAMLLIRSIIIIGIIDNEAVSLLDFC